MSDWMDKFGACKVCQGEIPHGHTIDCHIYKQDQRIAELTALRELLAEFHWFDMRDYADSEEEWSTDITGDQYQRLQELTKRNER